jgi:AbrB family looped-hinge helix DNA binding protein
MEIEITKISSKGQVVIPLSVRRKLSIQDGEILAVSTENDLIVLKKVKNPMEAEDILTLKEIKEAWKEIAQGKYRKMGKEEFLKEIETW